MAAESGALVGNGNPQADAEAAHGPDPTARGRPSPGNPHRTVNGAGANAPANGNADDMEKGQAGPAGQDSQSNKQVLLGVLLTVQLSLLVLVCHAPYPTAVVPSQHSSGR